MDTKEFDERNFAKSRAVCAEMAEACRKERVYETWCEEKAELYKLLDECGSVENIRKRLMPEGMNWPVFEDGEPVKVGDEFERGGVAKRVAAVHFTASSCYLCEGGPGQYYVGADEPVKRPKLAPIGADDLPIKKGDSVWANVGDKPVELTVLDIDPERFRGNGYVLCGYAGKQESSLFAPSQLTHVRPEPTDSWEKLEEDAVKDSCDYFSRDGDTSCDGCPAYDDVSCRDFMARDIVRRAKALAEASGS